MIRQLLHAVFGLLISASAYSAPTIDPELYHQCSRQAVVELVLSAQRLLSREVASVTYTAHDEPPVGRRAAIVKYVPISKGGDQFEFATSSFYLRTWKQDRPLQTEHKRVIAGSWFSDGVPFRDLATQFRLTGAQIFVRLGNGVDTNQVRDLLIAVEGKAYSIELDCGSQRWTQMLQSAGPQILYSLDVGTVISASREAIDGNSHISLWTTNQEIWEFEKTRSGYNLRCQSQYAI